MALEFLQNLFAPYSQEDGLLCEIRCLAPGYGEATNRYFGLTHLQRAAEYARALAADYNVYVGVLPRAVRPAPGRAGEDQHVTQAAYLWCDIDKGKATQAEVVDFLHSMQGRLPQPAMIVLSGSGGVHCYWRLSEAYHVETARAEFKSILRRLCAKVGSGVNDLHACKACCNLSRILRVPQTYNHKFVTPTPVEAMIVSHPDVLTLDEWEKLLPIEPLPLYKLKPRSNNQFNNQFHTISPKLLTWAQSGYAEGERHPRLTSDAAWLRRSTALPDEVAYDLFMTKVKQSPGAHPLTDEEVENIWKWAS